MKKNKQTKTERKITIHRNSKRSERLRKSQSEKNKKKMLAIDEKKKNEKKQNEEIEKILKSQNKNPDNFSVSRIGSGFVTFSQNLALIFKKKNLKALKEKELQNR
jgi:bifunctional ADP-heptose synthase (sugar kinase/adenylyltransferase)